MSEPNPNHVLKFFNFYRNFRTIHSDSKESKTKFYGKATCKQKSEFIADIIGPSDLIQSDFDIFEPVVFNFRQLGQYGHNGASISHLIRASPPLTSKNWFQWAPKIIRGTKSGILQVVNVYSGELESEISVHTNSLADMAWLDLDRVLTLTTTGTIIKIVKSRT